MTIADCAAKEPYATQIGPFGNKIRADIYTPSGAPVLRGTNVNPDGRFHDDDFVFVSHEYAETELNKFVCEADDVILCHKGTLGKIGIIPPRSRFPKYIMGNSMMKVRCDREILCPEYLYYWLFSREGQHFLFSRVSQVGVPQIQRPLSTLRECLLPVPPLPEQKAIASILGSLDDKIELNRRMNETLESMARAIFKSWFVDFDPVRAKMDGRHPPGMDQATADLFPDEFEHVNGELVPKGWRVSPLLGLAELLSGGTPKKGIAEYWDGHLPWISPKAMNAIHVHDSDDHVTDKAVGNGTRLVPSGTVLVMVRGMGLHQGVRISQAMREVTFNQDVKALVPTAVDGTFLLFALLESGQFLFSKVQASGHGTGVIPTDILQSLNFVVPPESVRIQLSEPLHQLNTRIAANVRETETLAALRDTLLPKLLSGELRVGDAALQLEQAV